MSKIKCKYCGTTNHIDECRKCGAPLPQKDDGNQSDWVDGGVPTGYPPPKPYSEHHLGNEEEDNNPESEPLDDRKIEEKQKNSGCADILLIIILVMVSYIVFDIHIFEIIDRVISLLLLGG